MNINIMIVKKKQKQIQKLQEQLTPFHPNHIKKEISFQRQRLLSKKPSYHRKSRSINLTDKYCSTQRQKPTISKVSEQGEWQQLRRTYNRPFQLLKQYLQRKQKHTFMPLFHTNPQKWQDSTKAYNTLNDFRIKKQKKTISLSPNSHLLNAPRVNKMDENFTSFSTKNMYQMTHAQLQQSIKWKKKFLSLLNEKTKGFGSNR